MHQRIISGAPSPCHSIKIVVLSQRNRKDSNSPEKTNMTCHCCPIMRSRIVGVPESMLIHFLYLILENESPSSESDSLYQSTCPLPKKIPRYQRDIFLYLRFPQDSTAAGAIAMPGV